MKFLKSSYFLIAILFLASCGANTGDDTHSSDDSQHQSVAEAHGNEMVFISDAHFRALNIKIDTISQRPMEVVVHTNGELEVPPQNEAAVTAIVGANVVQILVIEGDKVSKGQPLAYLRHPNLITLQTDYISGFSQLDYLREEYERQKGLYEENIGSGKEFQKAKAEYLVANASVKGLEAQLKQLGLNLERLKNGDIYETIPVPSPISGNVRLVKVKTGQYVQPETEMFSIVNIDHIHADFMVYESDIRKVREGQKIYFKVESEPEIEYVARIYAVGKAFEKEPKAVHIHAEIEDKTGFLLPGMYVRGKIYGDSTVVSALPEEAIATEADGSYVFVVAEGATPADSGHAFTRTPVRTGKTVDGWVEIHPLEPLPRDVRVAWNGAYYLEAELRKEDTGHSH